MQKLLPLNNSLILYQDLTIHTELLLNGAKFICLDDVYVKYRHFGDERNISCNYFKAKRAVDTDPFMNTFLEIQDVELLKEMFSKEIKETKIEPYFDTIPFFLGQMAILSPDKDRQIWGYKTIAKYISKDETYKIANEKYGFCFKDFRALIPIISQEDKSDAHSKFLRYKRYFNTTLISSCIVIALLLLAIFFLLLAGVKL
jgi:hypothetical protein